MKRKPFEVAPLVQVGAAFAAGALLAYLCGQAMLRRPAHSRHDAPLRERLRARVADLVSYPEAIQVAIEGRLVRVSGHVLASEADRLLSQLTQVPGVSKVYNALVAVDDPARFVRASGRREDGGCRPSPTEGALPRR